MPAKEATEMKSYINTDLYWNERLQEKTELVGAYLARQPFPLPELHMVGGQLNRSLLLHIVVLKLQKDLSVDDSLFRTRMPQYLEFYADNHDGEHKTSAYVTAEMMAAIDQIGRYLDNLPPDDRPAYVRAKKTYNRRLIITLSLCYAADVVQRLS